MDESSPSEGRALPVDPARLREVLGRAVRKICPGWISDQRDDLVQEACVRVIKMWQAAEENPGLNASYLWKVAHSAVMDELRRRRRRPEAELEHPELSEDRSPSATPEQSHAAAELGRAINEGVGLLKESRRWAVLLYLHGFSLQESARILGWNAKRVDNQRYQGLNELRGYLQERGLKP